MITVSIDPGLSGAIGFLDSGEFLAVEDTPTILKGSGSVKYEVDAAGVRNLINSTLGGRPFIAVIERVNAMPGQGVSSVFSLGDSFGSSRAVLNLTASSLVYVAPRTWKKYFGLNSDKEAARALAIKIFPNAPLNLKKYADRAEALLMARWLHENQK